MMTEIVNINMKKITQRLKQICLHKIVQIIKITILTFENMIKPHFITLQSKIYNKYYVYL